jgi:hypothetical protein
MPDAEIAELKRRIDRLQVMLAEQDERTDGLWLALLHVIDVFKARDPELLPLLLDRWKDANRAYDLAMAGQPTGGRESLHELEPRATLWRVLSKLSPTHAQVSAHAARKQSATHGATESDLRAPATDPRKPK